MVSGPASRTCHRGGRIPSELLLKPANDRLTDPGERALGPGNRANSVDDVTGLRIDAHFEQLLAALRVIRERAVRERDRLAFDSISAVQHSGTVQ